MNPRFQKAVLLYNPFSGKGNNRLEAIQAAAAYLRPLVGEITLETTRSAGSGGEQAREAIASGCDLVLACGGDGTVFEVLQGVANSQVTFGVLPFGTANVLAADLELSQNLGRAARQLVNYVPRRISLGRITYDGGAHKRYFTVAAGVGVHAELVYNANTQAKRAGGFAAYYVSGFRLLFKHRFVPFQIEVTQPDGTVHRGDAMELVGMRVRSFGRFLRRWRPGSALDAPYLQLVVLRESSRIAMVKYVFGAVAGTANNATSRADVNFMPCVKVRCTSLETAQATGGGRGHIIRSQADGEMLGVMPVEMEIVPDALTLLMPPAKGR
jgi:diacylglycerol kinase family enzyme